MGEVRFTAAYTMLHIRDQMCLMKNVIKQKDSEHVMCFLKGLNGVYNIIKTQIPIMELLPSVN